jgi:hypothetical protein
MSQLVTVRPDALTGHWPELVEQNVSEHASGSIGVRGSSDQKNAIRLITRRVVAGKQWVVGGRLKIPVSVHITGDSSGQLVATDEHTGIFGAGADLAAAINDFRAALVEHRAFLEASHPLSSDLEEQLDALRRLLRD